MIETIIYISLMVIGTILIAVVLRFRAYLTPLRKNYQRLPWEDMGELRLGGKRFRPVSSASYDLSAYMYLVRLLPGRREPLIATWNRKDHKLMEAFRLPEKLLSIRAIAVGRQWLYAAVNRTGHLVRIDIKEAINTGQPKIIGPISTQLRFIGAVCFVDFHGRRMLAMADNRKDRRTYLVDLERLVKTNDFESSVEASFLAVGHAKGMAWDGRYLYRLTGNIARDLIYRINLDQAVEGGSMTFGVVDTFNAVGRHSAGLMVIEGRLLTCNIFSRKLLAADLPASSE